MNLSERQPVVGDFIKINTLETEDAGMLGEIVRVDTDTAQVLWEDGEVTTVSLKSVTFNYLD